MRCLILSCNTGGGHNAAGYAMKDIMEKHGHEAVTLDYLSLAGKRVSKIVGDAYINIAKFAPALFGVLYKAGMLITSRHYKSPVYYANAKMGKYLYQYLEEHSFDIIIMPHLYPAETLTYMKKKYHTSIPTLAIGTDYTCIPFWEETDMDAYVIPHPDLTEEYIARGVPEEKLYPLGIPVRQSFLERIPKQRARQILGLEEQEAAYLVIGGSMGFGNLPAFVSDLDKRCGQGEQIVVICGNNRPMQRKLLRRFGNKKRVRIIGYTEQVPLYMDACDVVFTKPGGLSSTEALNKHIPIVHTAAIPGCETCNCAFFKARGLSYASRDEKKNIAMGRRLGKQGLYRREMLERQRKFCDHDVAEDIYSLAEKMAADYHKKQEEK